MLKTERNFRKVIGEVKIGYPVVLQAENGLLLRTSPVENYFCFCTGDITIHTKNSIYRGKCETV